MNRILPDMVLAAYEKTGLKPVQEGWTDVNDNYEPCACGLSVSYIVGDKEQRFGEMHNSYNTVEESIIEFISNKLTLDIPYAEGFVDGFDGSSLDDEVNMPNYTQGYEDGKACWLAVKHLA